MLNTALSDEEKGIQDKESKEESILAMLGIIGTILNLVVIIFVYIYTTLWDPPESTGTMIGSEILARKNQAVPPGDHGNTDTAAMESHIWKNSFPSNTDYIRNYVSCKYARFFRFRQAAVPDSETQERFYAWLSPQDAHIQTHRRILIVNMLWRFLQTPAGDSFRFILYLKHCCLQ